MLIRWRKEARIRTALVAAATYALCVVAPFSALAFGDASKSAHCLTSDGHGAPAVALQLETPKAHVHGDGHAHDHGQHSKPKATTKSADDDKQTNGQCCGIACITALPAPILLFASPDSRPIGVHMPLLAGIDGEMPSGLLRPPNT